MQLPFIHLLSKLIGFGFKKLNVKNDIGFTIEMLVAMKDYFLSLEFKKIG